MRLLLALAACHREPSTPPSASDPPTPTPAVHTGPTRDTGVPETGSTADTGPAPIGAPVGFVEHHLADEALDDPVIADLDGDGRPEVLAWDRPGRAVVVAHPDTLDRPVALVSEVDAFAVGDADGDGDLDLFLVSVEDDRLWWADNDGIGGFFATHSIDDALAIDVVAQLWTADIDADGRTDVWLAEPWFQGRGMRIWWNDAAGFVAGPNPCPACATTGDYDLLLGDADADGDLDAFVYGSALSPLNNRGDRTFAVGPDLTRDPAYELVSLLGLQDVDADGVLDLVWSENGVGGWSRALGGGAYAAAQPLPLTTAEIASVNLGVLVDLNADGSDDLAYTFADGLAVAEDAGAGVLTPHVAGPGLYVATAVTAGDVDVDGDPDVVVAAWGGLSWFENVGPDGDGDGLADEVEAELRTDPRRDDTDGDGVRDADEAPAGLDPLRADSDRDGVGDATDGCAGGDDTADADADGIPDGCEAPRLALAWTYASGPPFGSTADALATADLDADGDLDLASACVAVEWHENLGGLAWASPAALAAQSDVEELDLADLDADGSLDLVATRPSPGRATVLALDAGAVRASRSLTLSLVEHAALTDLDGTGLPDLVWSDGFDDLWLTPDDGGASFRPAVPLADLSSFGVEVADLSAVDLDGDAPDEVVLAGRLVMTVARRASGWVPIVADAPARAARRLAVGDVDGDGVPDLVVAGRAVEVLRRVPNGWDLPVEVASLGGVDAAALELADLDADGDLDLAWGGLGLPLTVAENRGGGVFAQARPVEDPLPDVVDLRVVDLDGDAVPEVVVHVELLNGARELRVYSQE